MEASEPKLFKGCNAIALVGGDKIMKGDPTDLRLAIERRKKYSTHEMGESPNSSAEQSVERFSKYHNRPTKGPNKRSRSNSSSSSSSSKSQKDEGSPEEKSEGKNEGFNKSQLVHQRETQGTFERGRPSGAIQVRIRGRTWNRGVFQGNISQNNPVPTSEDWNPDYTPKSKQYYLHDDRDEESERSLTANWGRGRGRARFIIRKGSAPPNSCNPKWASDQVNGEQSDRKQEDTEKKDHK